MNKREREIRRDLKRGYSVKEISERHRISRAHAYRIKKSQGINPDTGKPYGSANEYERHLICLRINSDTGRTFENSTEYADYLAKRRINPTTGKKFNSKNEMSLSRLREKIDPETGEASTSYYERKRKQQQLENQQRFETEISILPYEFLKSISYKAANFSYESLSKGILDILDTLEQRDEKLRNVIERRFFRGQTLRKVSSEMGVSFERIRQLEKEALERLRIIAIRSDLECYLQN
jgi:DNA-directed RNA polymerase sigma subunit (sigma70/sigma32)